MFKKNILYLIILICIVYSDPYEQLDIKFLKKKKIPIHKVNNPKINQKETLPRYEDLIIDLEKISGIFDFFWNIDQNKVFLSITPEQLETTFLANITRESGDGYYYDSSSMLNEFPFQFKRLADIIQFVHINVLFRADADKAIYQAVEDNFSNSIITKSRIVSLPHADNGAILVDANDLFLRDIGYISQHGKGRYGFDKKNSYFTSIKSFSSNAELAVSIHYKSNKRTDSYTLPNSRSMEIKYHVSISSIPENNYETRISDDRLGYFTTIYQDYSSTLQETQYVRLINRWNLNKKASYNQISEPIEPIVYWIENKVPIEFRNAIREGVLRWNSSFEKIGYKNAIIVKQMPDEASWDPADVRYNTIRWFIQPGDGYAVGPSRANPFTGELYDADIRISADFVRGFYREYDEFVNPVTSTELVQLWQEPSNYINNCEYATILREKMSFGWHHMIINNIIQGTDQDLEDYVHKGLVDLVLHEVGHTLGLRHNFKASSIFSISQLSDRNFTEKHGISGSVMDYHPINLFDGGNTVFQTKPGPYDDWVIEYGYKQLSPYNDLEQLNNIASKSNHPLLAYGTDEDTFGRSSRGIDPMCSLWDLSNDPINYYKNQLQLVNHLWGEAINKFKVDGNKYQKIRSVFSQGVGEYIHAGISVPKFIGGVYFHRNHIGDPGEQAPFKVVDANIQREALKFMKNHIFGRTVFDFSPELLNMLSPERQDDFSDRVWRMDRIDYPIHSVVKRIHSYSLYSLFHPRRLARIQDNELKTNEINPFTMQELFYEITNSIWEEILINQNITSYKRELQKVYIQMLNTILYSNYGFSSDAIALSRYSLSLTLKNIYSAIGEYEFNQYTKAHLENSAEIIEAILNAEIQIN